MSPIALVLNMFNSRSIVCRNSFLLSASRRQVSMTHLATSQGLSFHVLAQAFVGPCILGGVPVREQYYY
jgi:hypothetical protein